MPTSLPAENIFTLSPHPTSQFSIICEDEFLSYYSEKHIKSNVWRHANQTIQTLHYKPSNHLAIEASILSQDLFASHSASVLVVNGSDLKHASLVTLINKIQHVPIVFRIQKLSGAQKKTQGFIALNKQTTMITTKALSEKKTMAWFQGLLKLRKITLSPKLIVPLCQHLDWDLTSMAQLVEQMLQRGINTAHDLASIESCILTTSQAPIFTLLDKLFSGDVRYCHHFFDRHQQIDVLQKAYWLCIRRIQQYVLMQEKMAMHNISAHMVLQQDRIWPQLQKQYLRALSLSRQKLQDHYLAMCELEWIIKGLIKLDIGDQIKQRLMCLAKDLSNP